MGKSNIEICICIQIDQVFISSSIVFIKVTGHNIPGELNNIVYIFDTILPLKRPKIKPPFPTSFDEDTDVDVFAERYHDFRSPTILFEEN